MGEEGRPLALTPGLPYLGAMTRVLTIAAVGVGLFVAAVLAGLVGDRGGGPLDPVAKAADATASAGTVEIGMAGSVSAAGQTIPLNGSGAIDAKHLRADLSFTTQIPGAGQQTIEELMDGPVLYMKFPGLASQIPGGKQWVKLDLQAFGKKAGIDFNKLMQQSSGGAGTNPADMLRYLKAAGSSQVVGHETIRGVPTTHYHATIDIGKALDRIGDAQTEATLKQLYASMGTTTMPVDVWVDKSGLVRREQMSFAGNQFSMNMTIDFIRFGVPVDVNPPPDDQVVDMSSLLSSASKLSGG